MDSALSIGLGYSIFPVKPSIKPLSFPSHFHFTTPVYPSSNPPRGSHIRVWASSNSTPKNVGSSQNPITRTLKITAAAAIVLAAAVASRFQKFPARAEIHPTTVTEEKVDQNQQQEKEELEEEDEESRYPYTSLTQLHESNSVGALKSVLQEMIEDGENERVLEILKHLVSAQPEKTEWKFLMARLFNEMGSAQDARQVFDEILKLNPLSFEALFENSLLMDHCGEGNAAISMLEEAFRIAVEEDKVEAARGVRLIMAYIQLLQENGEEALRIYEELEREDPNDFRPYFCKGMMYSWLDMNREATEEFAKYRIIMNNHCFYSTSYTFFLLDK